VAVDKGFFFAGTWTRARAEKVGLALSNAEVRG